MLQVIQPTDEQTKKENSRKEEIAKSVKETLASSQVQSDILKDLGLSPEKAPEKKEKKEVVKDEEEPEEVEEVEEEADEEEEVIPKSKIQPRIDKLSAQIKAQQKEIEELRAKAEPKDDFTRQLESMTEDQLRAARKEVRLQQIDAKEDKAKLNELLDLEDKIESVLKGAPERFKTGQLKAYNKAVQDIVDSGDIEDLDKAGPKILAIAKEIYDENPIFQKDINGQAAALKLAVKHYKGTINLSGDKTKETDLKRQVNSLKRKTTLDTKSTKGNIDQTKLDALKKAAMGGTTKQKVELIKTHPAFNIAGMIPDEYKQSLG